MNLKPGDLVEPDWVSAKQAQRQLGLVLSHPEVKDHGTLSVKVDWLGWNFVEYYSVHHLKIVENKS